MDDRESAGSRAGRGPGAAFADLPERLLSMLRASPAGEIEQHLRAGLQQGIEKLDLVTREEYELQAEMVERLRARIEALEARIQAMEAGDGTN